MEHIIKLTEEQEKGLMADAEHNSRELEDYILWRLVQYADRGNSELLKARLSSIQSKLTSEPSIIEDVSVIVDGKVAECVAVKEALVAEEKIEEKISEVEVMEKI